MERTASDTGAHHLGKRRLDNKSAATIDLEVKLQNESQPKSILAVFLTYLTTSFPTFLSSCVSIPQFFSYKPKKGIHGFPSRGLAKVGKDWNHSVQGPLGEEKVFNSLRNAFKYRTSLLLQGFELSNFLKLAKEQQGESGSTSRESFQMTSYDKNLGEALEIDFDVIDSHAKQITGFIVENSNKQTLDHMDLENKKTLIKEDQQNDRNTVKVVNLIMQNKDWPVVKDDIQTAAAKETKDVAIKVKTIVDRVLGSQEAESINKETLEIRNGDLKKQLKKFEEALNIIEILLKQKASLSTEEITSVAAKYIFNIRVQDNQELDTIIVDKDTRTIFHLETKVLNTEIGKDKDKESQLTTLRNLIKGACGQIKTGRHLIKNVITRGIDLPGWSILAFVCLPELKDKTLLQELGIEDRFLPFFLTEKELESEELPKLLSLDVCRTEQKDDNPKTVGSTSEIDEEKAVRDEEYTNLLAWIIGAINCTINSQTFDYSLDLDRVTKNITGNWEESAQVQIDINNCCAKCTGEIPNLVSLKIKVLDSNIIAFLQVKKKKLETDDLKKPLKCRGCGEQNVMKKYYGW